MAQGASPFRLPGNRCLFQDDTGNTVELAIFAGSLQMSVNGGAFSAVGGGNSFGADTIVQLANASAQLKNALELITTMPVNTAGSEMTQWLMEVLISGVQTKLLALGNFVGFPFVFIGDPANTDGILNASAHRLQFYINGSNYMEISTGVGGVQFSFPVSTNGVRLTRAATASVAVATTITIPTATTVAGNIVPLTVGTGTLNSIVATGFPTNTELKLLCPSGVTITNNVAGTGATILTSTGASIVTASKRVIPIFYDGTNWITEG